jgi:hypothetical protein
MILPCWRWSSRQIRHKVREMENNLFRKSSLERISSPDQLNEYIKVINPGVILLLIGFFVVAIAVAIWAFTGTIPDTIQENGIAFPDSTAMAVYTYLPMSAANRLAVGMSVQFSPNYAPKEAYGFIYGKIASIGQEPISEQALITQYGNLQYLQGLLPQGNFVEVKIEPLTAKSSGPTQKALR